VMEECLHHLRVAAGQGEPSTAGKAEAVEVQNLPAGVAGKQKIFFSAPWPLSGILGVLGSMSPEPPPSRA
jgi:hypothetical protein